MKKEENLVNLISTEENLDSQEKDSKITIDHKEDKNTTPMLE